MQKLSWSGSVLSCYVCYASCQSSGGQYLFPQDGVIVGYCSVLDVKQRDNSQKAN